MHANDLISTLQSLGMLKYWKGKHVILRNDVSFYVVLSSLCKFDQKLTVE